MTGTLINFVAVLAGGTLGALMGDRLPDRFRQIIMQALGLIVFVLALQMSIETQQILVVLGAILLGVILGEWWDLDLRFNQVGYWLESKARRYPILTRGNFVRGFVASSLIIGIGPMAILGSIQDGLSGDYTVLAIKSIMDFFVTLALGAAFGMGVAFSAISIIVVQGSITLGASLAETIMTDAMIAELTATGGVILLGLGITMLEIKKIKVANFLPALFLAPLFAIIWRWLGL